VWRWDSDPFGKMAANEDPDGDGTAFVFNLRFAGQYYDKETRLHYNYFRYYDPSTGRYITSDPIGLAGGLNIYGYVGGNPIMREDFLGLRNFIVVVWTYDLSNINDISVGHVVVAETYGEIIESSFPEPHRIYGINTQKSWNETLNAENRKSSGIYQVHLPDDAAAISAADNERMKEKWSAMPLTSEQTNCTIGAHNILKAGKLKGLKYPLLAPYSPLDMKQELNRLSEVPDSGVIKLNRVSW
jgi:RHS repeat-associated protein